MIRVKHLVKRYRAVPPARGLAARLRTALAAPPATAPWVGVMDVSFRAQDGAITGLLGPNGAGKTTTLRMVAGLLAPQSGQVQVDGLDLAEAAGAARARLGVLGDPRGLYPRLTARENVLYFAALQGVPREQAESRLLELAEALEMRPLLDRRTEGFSQGERMKTSLARALIHDPPNLLLDEPTNGLDVVATRALRAALRHLASPAGGGKCILLSSHVMSEVERLCDEIVVVARGRTVAQGTVARLCEETGQRDFEEAFIHLAFGPVIAALEAADTVLPPEAAGEPAEAAPRAGPQAPASPTAAAPAEPEAGPLDLDLGAPAPQAPGRQEPAGLPPADPTPPSPGQRHDPLELPPR